MYMHVAHAVSYLGAPSQNLSVQFRQWHRLYRGGVRRGNWPSCGGLCDPQNFCFHSRPPLQRGLLGLSPRQLVPEEVHCSLYTSYIRSLPDGNCEEKESERKREGGGGEGEREKGEWGEGEGGGRKDQGRKGYLHPIRRVVHAHLLVALSFSLNVAALYIESSILLL